MHSEELQEIINCLPKGKTVFHYYRDRYALMILAYITKSGMTMKELKQSRFSGLLNKSVVKQVTSGLKSSSVCQESFGLYWPKEYEAYLLTLGQWGNFKNWRGYQVSRPGKNLVLQLNFSSKHNRQYFRWINPEEKKKPFVYFSHPVSKDRLTLAWARVDLSLLHGEALIEEIQNDWIREVFAWKKWLSWKSDRKIRGTECSVKELDCYMEEALSPHLKIWDEAMMAATIWFLREELGIKRIFYNTFETGNRLKHINQRTPPRSLYTTLPRRFCFEESHESPLFLKNSNHRRVKSNFARKTGKWFVLEI
jgi:hypothetical protein